MWNSIEGLARLFYASQWATVILGALTTLAIVFSIVVSVRKDRLVDEKAAKEAKASKEVIETQNKQISTLTDDLTQAQGRLEKLTAQRSITPEQKNVIVNELRKAGRMTVAIVKTQDLETQKYANEIERTLQAGNWVVERPFQVIESVAPGMIVMVRNRNNPPKAFDVLLHAFALAKVPVHGVSDHTKKEEEVFLWIGPNE